MIDNLFGDISFETPPLPADTCEECCGYGWVLHDFYIGEEDCEDWVDCSECKGTGKTNE